MIENSFLRVLGASAVGLLKICATRENFDGEHAELAFR
jgi:hypothetical protein